MGDIDREISSIEEEEANADGKYIWKYLFGFVEMAVVKCAIELKIAETIENHQGPITLSQLSSSLGCAPSFLYRIMRFLIHRHVFKEQPTTIGTCHLGYVQTPLSRRLMRHAQNSIAAFVLLESSPVMLEPWHGLSTRVLANGPSSFESSCGEDLWSYAAANPSHSLLINDALACHARVTVPAILEGCPTLLEGLGSLVDVGGGNGTTMRMLVEVCHWIRGINFDLPHVVSVAPDCDGVDHVGGDMFVHVPKADAAFLMSVLHDWSDDECIKILKNCREAISNEKGKVIIIEAIIGEVEEENMKDIKLMLDMVMMAHTNAGKERTLREWANVIEKAGFSRYTVTPIPAAESVIEAYP